jgi:hypothetical protein
MARVRSIAITLAFGLLSLRGADAPPLFINFPVAGIYHGPVKPPNFGSPEKFEGTDLRCFGGDPSEFAKEHVNFAGHFVVGACTCGTGCHYLFMWDAVTGKFYERLPPAAIDVGPYDMAGPDPIEYKGEEYHIDSSLLVVDGCVEDTCDCATRYYRWDERAFREISSTVTRVPTKCRK